VAKVAQKTFLIDISVITGCHFRFHPLVKNADIFGRDLGTSFFRNGPWNSIPPSKQTSRRVITELWYMTILYPLLRLLLVYFEVPAREQNAVKIIIYSILCADCLGAFSGTYLGITYHFIGLCL